ncbi:hypothetical protein GCM10022197_17630 [Microlunatus spumicola]|uniref:Uncharacterized protein n=1 Tax=Microlunatus spumicola TaxID=81499 RepID=A0ABP6X9A3_9ACTN
MVALGADNAARDTLELVLAVGRAQREISQYLEQLGRGFHAVEWHDSGYYGKGELDEVLKAYRGTE